MKVAHTGVDVTVPPLLRPDGESGTLVDVIESKQNKVL